MTLEQIEHIAKSEVMFAILLIAFMVWYLRRSSKEKEDMQKQAEEHERYMIDLHTKREDLLTNMLAETRADAKVREDELIANMRKMVDQQERIGDTLKEVSAGLVELEKKVDNNVLEIWRVMAGKTPFQKGE